MATVDAEKKLQNRVLHWLIDDLGYTYLGNLEDIDNTPVKEELLKANLKKRGYTDDQIKTAISELVNKVNRYTLPDQPQRVLPAPLRQTRSEGRERTSSDRPLHRLGGYRQERLFRSGGGIRPALRQGNEEASRCGAIHQRNRSRRV